MIRRVEPLAAAKVMGLAYAAVGVIIGVIFAAVSLLAGLAVVRASGLWFGIAAIIIMPILYGCIGFVMTLIAAAVYNWAAGVAGGIQIQTD